MNLAPQLKKMEELFSKLQGKDEIAPLVISTYHKDSILGFSSGDDSVMRWEGESIEHLEKRAIDTLKRKPGALLLTAITKQWGNWPYMPQPTEDEWCREVKKYYQSMGESQ